MASIKAVIAIWGEGKSSPPNGEGYVGIAELQSFGFSRVEIHLPVGVKPFPKLPYMCLVDCDEVMAEMRAGRYPLITVTKWYEVENLIQDNFKGVVK